MDLKLIAPLKRLNLLVWNEFSLDWLCVARLKSFMFVFTPKCSFEPLLLTPFCTSPYLPCPHVQF